MTDIYNTQRWRRLRERILRRDGYQCQIAKRYGRIVEAQIVHHIFPADEFPEYRWEPWNLISISKVAHENIHDRATNDLTEEGAELLRRTARKNHIDVPLRYKR